MCLKAMFFVSMLFTCHYPHNGNLLSLDSPGTIPDIHRKLGEILNSCYTSSLNTLLATDDLSEVTRAVGENKVVNVFLINKNFDSKQHHGFLSRWPMFLLSANSETALTVLLQRLKSSDFWKFNSTFFILGDGCDSASTLLHTAWRINLLTSFYICKNVKGELLLYTFNPFMDSAPHPWTKVATDLDKRWNLYCRVYDIQICKNLEFDKTISLNEYPIKIVTMTIYRSELRNGRNDDLKIFKEETYTSDAMTLLAVWSLMKIKPNIYYIDRRKLVNGKPIRIDDAFTSGAYDMAGFTRYIRPHFNSFTYPFVASNIAILTRHRNFLNPVEKIINFYSSGAVCLIAAAFLITWAILIAGKNNSRSSAALEVLRVLLSTSVLHPLREIPLRIYLFGIWWLVIILNSTFQGQMSSFLTKPERYDIETLDDLIHLNYHIYVNSFYHALLPAFWKKFPKHRIHLIEKEDDCYPYVINDSSAACIQNIAELYQPVITHDLHVSRPLSLSPYITFQHRTDWSLAKKVNTYLSRLAASGILDYWKEWVDDDPLKKIRAHEAQTTAPQVRAIVLNDIIFAFVMLAVGLTVAGICLIYEIYNGVKNKLAFRPAVQ